METGGVEKRDARAAGEAAAAVPSDVPTIGELKKSLPPHCFAPSLSLSFYFVLKDLVIVASLYASMIALTEGPLSMHWEAIQ